MRLDPPVRRGGVTVAVLCDIRIIARRFGGAFAVSGRKTPVAVLVDGAEGLIATDLRGRTLDVASLEEDCPGLRAAMRARENGA